MRRNWRNAAGDPVANMDLWRRVLDAAARHEIAWHWVRGHAGHALNERADQVATAARERLIAGDGGQVLGIGWRAIFPPSMFVASFVSGGGRPCSRVIP